MSRVLLTGSEKCVWVEEQKYVAVKGSLTFYSPSPSDLQLDKTHLQLIFILLFFGSGTNADMMKQNAGTGFLSYSLPLSRSHTHTHTHTYTRTHTHTVLQIQTTIGFSESSHSGQKSILHSLSPIIRSHVDNPTIYLTFKSVGEKEKQKGENKVPGGERRRGFKQQLGKL